MRRKYILYGTLGIVGVGALLWGSFYFGYEYGQKTPRVVVVRGLSNIEPAGTSTIDFGPFWEAWNMINDVYLQNAEVTDQNKVYGAIKGLVQSLDDPNSEFLIPSDDEKFQQDIQGSFGGIGAEIGIRKNQLVIVAPLKDTPAMRAGLRAGDRILKINASSTEGLVVDEAVKRIRGPEGTKVVLTIFRDDWEKSKDITIVRETIVIPTLDFRMEKDGIVHVELHSFNANAHRLFYEAMRKTLPQGARGLILDLRNNPGGYLEVAVDLASWFVPRGELIVSEVSRSGVLQEFRAGGNEVLREIPVVVLVNGGSASASEILAGALRDIRGIKLIGEKSFGKGTVQQVFSLRDDSSLKLTIAHWRLPSGKTLGQEGLTPDIEVKMTEEDIEAKRDPQLEKAIEVLQAELNK